MSKTITILGSTGSIGTQTLEVIRNLNLLPHAAHHFKVAALSAYKNIKLLEEQAREFMPEAVCIADESLYSELKTALADLDILVLCGREGLRFIAEKSVDIVLNALVGISGLEPTLKAIEAGNIIALANKETLVAGGSVLAKTIKDIHADFTNILDYIRPVDSEHSAVWQCLCGFCAEELTSIGDPYSIILTASGGPFRGFNRKQLAGVTTRDALKHPNWNMGAKVTIDSSTLMNKGLEYIEAKYLFGDAEIEIVVHPQSIVHSAVRFADGAVIAQMGEPDMKLPIQYALTYPSRLPLPSESFSLQNLTFEPPDLKTFGCLSVCIEAHKKGAGYCTAVNAANETAVNLFLHERIPYLGIEKIVANALNKNWGEVRDYKDIAEIDRAARCV